MLSVDVWLIIWLHVGWAKARIQSRFSHEARPISIPMQTHSRASRLGETLRLVLGSRSSLFSPVSSFPSPCLLRLGPSYPPLLLRRRRLLWPSIRMTAAMGSAARAFPSRTLSTLSAMSASWPRPPASPSSSERGHWDQDQVQPFLLIYGYNFPFPLSFLRYSSRSNWEFDLECCVMDWLLNVNWEFNTCI